MKKVTFTIVICSLVTLFANAQFATYDNIYEMEAAKEAPTQSVYGYLYTGNGWVRTTLKLKVYNNTVLVVGYKQKDTSQFGGAFATYGNSNPWRSCSSHAEPVSIYSDGRELANSFDYKAYISGFGTVYF